MPGLSWGSEVRADYQTFKNLSFKKLRFYKWKVEHKHVNTCHRVIISDNDKEGSVVGWDKLLS